MKKGVPYKILAGLVTVALVLVAATLMRRKSDGDTFIPMQGSGSSNSRACTGGRITFDQAPVDLGDRLGTIKPMGTMSNGGHVTPTDHMYFITPDWMSGEKIVNDIFSPADGTITDIEYMESFLGKPESWGYDYRVVIEHTCSISSIFIHIDYPAEKILEAAPEEPGYRRVNIPVEEGELIGSWKGQLDYSVLDEEVTLEFANLDRYKVESFKIHCVDPFDYYNDTITGLMQEKNLRTVEPFGGIIDYDKEGTLLGNWFKVGPTEGILWEYNALAVAYDHIDPSFIVVSLGDFEGEAQVFGTKANSPDPADVTKESGIVKYDLDRYWYKDSGGQWWDEESVVKGLKAANWDDPQGVVLFQLLEDGRLKMEAFPGKTSDEVDDFDDGYLLYER